jgi:spermidine/putrescine transport system substrate-binding protein
MLKLRHCFGRLGMLMMLASLAIGTLTSVTIAVAQTSNTSPKTLYLYNWNNYIAPDTLQRFETQCRCRVVQDYYSDNEEMLAKLAAGATGYDVIVPTQNAVQSLIRQQVLRPLNHHALPQFASLKPQFTNQTFDRGNQYSVPYAYTISLLGYNQQKMQELGIPTDSWAAIFEPRYLQKLKGRVTVLDSQRELMAAAMKYLGYSINDTDTTKWQRARDVILRAKPYWAAFNASSYIKELTIGHIWLAHGYSNDMYQARQDALQAQRPFQISYRIPKEGAVLAIDSMVLHHTGKQPELAHQFINFMLQGESAAQLTNLIGAGNPNQAAMQYIRPELASYPAIFPDAATLQTLETMQDFDRHQRRVMNRLWTEIKLR